jgi:hypothetical protein
MKHKVKEVVVTKELVDKLYDPNISKREYDSIIYAIDERFSDVVTLIHPTITNRNGWFVYGNFDYDSEEDEGHFDPDRYKDEICIGGKCLFPEPYCFTDEGNGYIPTRWLWTDDEDILKEYKKEVKQSKKEKERKKEKNKQKRKELKERKKKMKIIITSKLSKEELKYIQFK